MNASTVTLRSDELRQGLLPRLRGRVFHVTTHQAYSRIIADGAIKPDPTPGPSSPPNAYFRSRGCVSVCDLRNVTDPQIDLALEAYFFLNPEPRGTSPAFLFLAELAFPRLLPGQVQIQERALDKLVVPHIEAGYQGDLNIALIEEVLFVRVTHSEPNEHLQALLRHGGPRGRAG